MRRALLALAGLVLVPAGARAFTVPEHAVLADSVLARVAPWWPDGVGVPDLSALAATVQGRDIHPAHVRLVEQSVWDELASVEARDLEALWNRARTRDPEAAGPGRSAVANFLLHHWTALRFADEAGRSPPERAALLDRAFRYEAAAQTYLADAFSSGHMLLPLHDPLWRTHATNNSAGHAFYSGQGCFVMNSEGEVWQAFGDGYLEWYRPAFDRVIAGCERALVELLLVFYAAAGDRDTPPDLADALPDADIDLAARPGPAFYAERKLPSLLAVPMPVSATWSFRTEARDGHGIARRRHRPQLLAEGWYDPGLDDIDIAYLYRPEQFPAWMAPDAGRAPGDTALLHDPAVASVRYVQERNHLPTRVGLILGAGLGAVIPEKGSPGRTVLLSASYTSKTYLLLANAWIVPGVSWYPRFHHDGGSLVSASVGLALSDPADRRWLQPEIGYAWGTGDISEHGIRFTLGLDLVSTPVSLTYSGFTLRALLEVFDLDETYFALGLQGIIH